MTRYKTHELIKKIIDNYEQNWPIEEVRYELQAYKYCYDLIMKDMEEYKKIPRVCAFEDVCRPSLSCPAICPNYRGAIRKERGILP